MPLPEPVPGLVIRYAYLWAAEHRRGQEEGIKDRPCVVVMITTYDAGNRVVTVLPVTRSPPRDHALAVEIPYATKQRLGLDEQASWIIISEANRFTWPGPDIRLGIAGDSASAAFGLLPRALFKTVQDRLVSALERRLLPVISRTQ